MTALAAVVFLLVLLGVAGAIAGSVMFYRRQQAEHATTVEKLQRLNADLLKDIRFEGARQLRKTIAGRELLALLAQKGELPTDDEWSDDGYRQQKRTDARKHEMESRYRNVTALRMVGRQIMHAKKSSIKR